MRPSFLRRLGALVTIGFGLAGPALAAATLRTASFDARTGVMAVEFDGELPAFAVRDIGSGPALVLEGVAVGAARLNAVEGRDIQGSLSLRPAGSAGALQAVEAGNGRIALRFSQPSSGNHYRLGIGDVVSVSVFKNPELSTDYPVGADGSITMPLLGRVPAAGSTERELGEALSASLGRFLVEPQVSVSIKTFQSQFVHVAGAVPRAMRVAIRPGMNLKDVLSEAGVSLLQGQRVALQRAGSTDPVGQWDRDALESGPSVALLDGDVLTVEDLQYVFIQGEVRRPQKLVLTSGMTLLQAITQAEGLTEWASKREVRILRGSEEVVVDLRKVEDRKIEDPKLKAGDVVLIRRRIL